MYNQRLFGSSKQDIFKNLGNLKNFLKLYKIMQILKKLTKIIINYTKNKILWHFKIF